MAFSAISNPSALPIATAVYFLFKSFAKASILKLGSNPAAEQNNIGD